MILLDTNYLIGVLVRDSHEARKVVSWYREEELCTSAVCWYEFLCGPVDQTEAGIVSDLLHRRILPVTAETAAESARLFNAAGRGRRLRVNAMIAAGAMIADASLATANRQDFHPFEAFGLILMD